MELGLRERKRRETRRALQAAILEQSIQRGYDRVTIEDVCRVADVSPRTFFNYFASKEDAVLGAALGFPDDEAVARYVEGWGGDALRDLPELFLSMSGLLDDVEILGLRKRLLRQEPGLLGLRVSSSRAFENLLSEVVLRRLQRDDHDSTSESIERVARLTAMVGFAAMRHGWLAWIDAAGTASLETQLRQSFRDLEFVVEARPVPSGVIG